jgi:general secretion pathway protein H
VTAALRQSSRPRRGAASLPLRAGRAELWRSRRHPRGFTLIEIGVVLLVVVLLVGVAIPTLRSVSGAQGRAEVSKIAANIRATRGHAAVSGRTCRVAFDLDDGTYLVECAPGHVSLAQEKSRNGERDEDEPEGDVAKMSVADRAKAEVMHRARFAAENTVPPQHLPGNLEFGSIWTQHQSEKYTKGKAYLYFYPSGLGERANIQVQDGDDWYSIHVSPLSGKVKIVAAREDFPDQREDEE